MTQTFNIVFSFYAPWHFWSRNTLEVQKQSPQHGAVSDARKKLFPLSILSLIRQKIHGRFVFAVIPTNDNSLNASLKVYYFSTLSHHNVGAAGRDFKI